MVKLPPAMRTMPGSSRVVCAKSGSAMLMPPKLWPRKYGLPVAFHVRDGPAIEHSGIERLVEFADMGVAVISVFALGVGVVHQKAEAHSAAARRPLQHFEVAVGIAERGDWTLADMGVNPDGLSGSVIDEIDFGQAEQFGLAVAHSEPGLD